MTARECVAALVAERAVVATVVVATLVATVLISFALPVSYAARAVVVVDTADPDLNLRTPYYSGRLIRDDHNPFVDWFMALVRSGEATPSTPGVPEAELVTTSVIGTEVITAEIVGRSSDPARAAEVANAVATRFAGTVGRPAPDTNPRALRAQLRARLERPAAPPSTPSSPSVVVVALVGVVAAATLGVAGGLDAARRRGRRHPGLRDGAGPGDDVSSSGVVR